MRQVRIFGIAVLLWSGVWSGIAKADELQSKWVETLQKIETVLKSLRTKLSASGVEVPLSDFDRVWKKIGPQATLRDRPLVVTMLGLHNSGKSTLVNLLAEAAGDNQLTVVSSKGGETTLPVVLLSNEFPTKEMPKLFGGFTIQPLRRPEDASKSIETETPLIFWKKHKLVPKPLAIVDAPDVDSWHREHSDRADAVINVSDVVMVLLGDQYKNHDLIDALEKVAKAGKPVMLVFNKSHMKYNYEDGLWAKRTKELVDKTGIQVVGVYAIENDPDKARAGELLDFFAVEDPSSEPELVKPLEAIERLELHKLRIRSELGSLELALSGEEGLEKFLDQLEELNSVLTELRDFLTDKRKAEFEWPAVPTRAVTEAILDAWEAHHQSWTTKGIRMIPNLLVKRMLRGALSGWRAKRALEEELAYREREFTVLRENVLKVVYDKLVQLVKSKRLSGEAQAILESKISGEAWSDMQEKLRATHASMKLVDNDLRDSIVNELERIKEESPTKYDWYRNGDAVLAGLELMGPLVLGMTAGGAVSGLFVKNFFASMFTGGAHLVTFVGTATPSGVVSAESGDMARRGMLAASMRNILREYADRRVAWLFMWLKDNHLKTFFEALDKSLEASSTSEIGELRELIGCAEKLSAEAS